MNKNILAGAFLGSVVTTGILLFVKFKNMDAAALQQELEDYTKEKAAKSGEDYLKNVYGITAERVAKLQTLATRLGA